MKVNISVDKREQISKIDDRLYGSFIEHLGRAVYGGIYEPNHITADENGFRKDVIDLVKQAKVPMVRYPGGNFVSGYNWEDGTGDKNKRPKKLDLAWHSIETNEVGIDEFQQWAKKAETEIVMAVNLGTRGAKDAQNLVEYCNLDTDTYYANLRKQNGFDKPFNIKTWCLGNEMDGPWQIGSKTAEEYGRLATETAKLMKWVDPSIELVACGSSYYDMPTFGEWERTVLDHAYDYVDYLSLHTYYGNGSNDTKEFLAKSVQMDEFIKTVVRICDEIKTKKQSDKQINLSFDEWNVWYREQATKQKDWAVAPPLLEEVYNFEDALLVGLMMITLQNNSDRVKMACLAQLVNVIAPIMTEPNGKAYVQTIYYPYMYASLYGRGTALKVNTDSDSYQSKKGLTVPYIQASVIDNQEKREVVLFVVNRSLTDSAELCLELTGYENAILKERIELYSDDLKSENTKDKKSVSPVSVNVSDKLEIKKHSWNMFVYKY